MFWIFLKINNASKTPWLFLTLSCSGHTIQEIRLSIIAVAGNEKENAQKSI